MWRWGFGIIGLCFLVGFAGSWPLTGMVASLSVLLLVLWHLGRSMLVTVPEENAAVIIDPDRGRFLRLLPPGRHRLRPFLEVVDALIPLGSELTTGRCQAYSDGGVPLELAWRAIYQLQPYQLTQDAQARLARKLASKHGKLLEAEATAALQHILSTIPLQELLGSGGRGRLERAARQAAAEELTRLGISLKRIRVVAIDLPPDIRDTLAAAHQRAVEAESQASALARLQAVISGFTEQDMQRLTELERLRLLGQNGLAYGWPPSTIIDIPGPARHPAGAAAWN